LADSQPSSSRVEKRSPAELNPLLNPVLEQNLGRWAEVYFTAPPGNRDQAVNELLDQLSRKEASDSAPRAPAAAPAPAAVQSLEAPQKIVCSACHGSNRPEHQYCGFCGAPLRAPSYADPSAREAYADPAPRAPYADPASRAPYADPAPRTAYADPGIRQVSPSDRPVGETFSVLGLGNPAPESDLSFLRDKPFRQEYYEPETGTGRWKFLTVVLILALAGAGYFEWPFLKAHLQPMLQQATRSQAPAAQVPAAQIASPAPGTPPAAIPPQEPAPGPAQATSAQAAGPQAGQTSAPTPDGVQETDIPPSATNLPAQTDPQGNPAAKQPVTFASKTEAAGGDTNLDGNSELLQARRYLDGRHAPRDPSLAATWLWKAVAKQNTQADLLLADLYARGDGISRNCDQARILLVAAAEKGNSAAADQLRSFDSTGCR
jgi:hypothetical protein